MFCFATVVVAQLIVGGAWLRISPNKAKVGGTKPLSPSLDVLSVTSQVTVTDTSYSYNRQMSLYFEKLTLL